MSGVARNLKLGCHLELKQQKDPRDQKINNHLEGLQGQPQTKPGYDNWGKTYLLRDDIVYCICIHILQINQSMVASWYSSNDG